MPQEQSDQHRHCDRRGTTPRGRFGLPYRELRAEGALTSNLRTCRFSESVPLISTGHVVLPPLDRRFPYDTWLSFSFIGSFSATPWRHP